MGRWQPVSTHGGESAVQRQLTSPAVGLLGVGTGLGGAPFSRTHALVASHVATPLRTPAAISRSPTPAGAAGNVCRTLSAGAGSGTVTLCVAVKPATASKWP